MYLLDTNILIYFLQGNRHIIDVLNDLCQDQFSISVISRLELLVGLDKDTKTKRELELTLDECKNIPVDTAIATAAADLFHSLKSKLKFKDLVIAATAEKNGYTVITCDKDFKKLKDVKVLLVKPN